MLWTIYKWLGPLFEPCCEEKSIAFHYEAPLTVNDEFGSTLFSSYGEPLSQVVYICPTMVMDALVALAVIGVLAMAFSLVGSLVAMLRPNRRRPDPIWRRFVERMDRLSNDYLDEV